MAGDDKKDLERDAVPPTDRPEGTDERKGRPPQRDMHVEVPADAEEVGTEQEPTGTGGDEIAEPGGAVVGEGPTTPSPDQRATPPESRRADSFAFSDENLEVAKRILLRYPPERKASAVIPILHLVQQQTGGWLPQSTMDYVAEFLGMPHIRVYEVATFYDMFHVRPVGRHMVRVCTTTPCMLRGSDDIVDTCKRVLGCDVGGTSPDGLFTLTEFECLGACSNAPMMWIDDDYYEDLDPEHTERILEAIRRGETPRAGSVRGRHCSAPEGERTTLLDSRD